MILPDCDECIQLFYTRKDIHPNHPEFVEEHHINTCHRIFCEAESELP